jgi:predicted HicB family RNase H-like nuclease
MAKMKMIQVEAKTHSQAKRQATKENMSLKAYIQKLLDDAIKQKEEGEK